jgi:G protein-coupled receptor GPR1
MTSMRSGGGDSFHETTSPALAPITEHNTSPSIASTDPTNKALRRRRKAIQRQLRLLFIYPVAYLILWVFPAVNHALNYSNHYVQNPIFAISVLNIFCQNVMGLCDVCIFCWREKPWRHIPGSDGTFSGSFFFWRYAFSSAWRDEQRRISSAFAAEKEKDAVASSSHGSQSGLLGSLKRWSMSISGRSGRQPSEGTTTTTTMTVPSHPTPPRRAVVAAGARPGGHHRRAHSGRSDRKVLEAEHARERLAMERADWSQNLQSLYDRQASAISLHQQQQRMSPGRKEWWDRNMSVDHDADDDNDDDVV